MPIQLIPAELLQKSNKILFVAHLALGDFTYFQNCFRAFAGAYPHLKIHLWVDEVRRTGDATKWSMLKSYSLYDWVRACPFFEKVYDQTYSPQLLHKSITEAQAQEYPIVVSLATLRPAQYAALARAIGPHAFVVGMQEKWSVLSVLHFNAYRRLDAVIRMYQLQPGVSRHISAVYAGWFASLFGLQIAPVQRYPFVDIPAQWQRLVDQRLEQWEFGGADRKRVFVNSFAKTKKRCWPLQKVAELIRAMQEQDEWRDACFVINAMPHDMPTMHQFREREKLKNIEL
ncbi:MAG: lipopolysaccharide heptosyltransferase family protein, partial [Herbaspirillum sp.]